VVANQTVGSDELLDELKERRAEDARTCSSSSCPRRAATGKPTGRRARAAGQTLDGCGARPLVAGQVGDPDPYTAIDERAPVLPRSTTS
jgi:hypothetical protein